MRGRFTLFCSFLVFLCLSSMPLHAAVQGHVIDSSQNPIEGAHVTFTDESNPANSFSGNTNADGWYEIDLTPLAVSENQPQQFSLGQNFPNPFNPATTIPFTIDQAGHVTLTVYNIMGQKVATVIDTYMSAGNHSVKWNGMDSEGNHVSAGIYLYRLKAGRHVGTRKMLLLDGGGRFTESGANRSINNSAIAKSVQETTYTVTITGDSIYYFEKEGVITTGDQLLDFVVFVRGVTTDIHGMTFTYIPGDTFEMGDETNNLGDECSPVHTVTVSGFEMSIYEITNAQYAEYLNATLVSGDITANSDRVVGVTGKWIGKEYFDLRESDCEINFNNGEFLVESGKENRPTVWVTWFGAKAFAEYYGLDLPTEAEWEYACRGGKQYMFGTNDGTLNQNNANYGRIIGHTTDVGSYPSNPFGLFDMCGNAREWCHDWLGEYSAESIENPIGPQNGIYRVVRGGWHGGEYRFCPSALRTGVYPQNKSYGYGFRVVRRLEEIIPETYTIYGKVLLYDSGLSGVTVSLDGQSMKTDSEGVYSFIEIPEGSYTLSFSKIGYIFEPANMEITISDGSVIIDDIIATEYEYQIDPHDIHGITFVSIPGGTFEMGYEGWYPYSEMEIALPVHAVTLSDFKMSTCEITNAQYAEYLTSAFASGDVTVSDYKVKGDMGKWVGMDYCSLHEIKYNEGMFSAETGKENRPVVNVTWYGAKAFATHFGFDLPTEAEWEYACRGGRQYCYGTNDGTIDSTKVNYEENKIFHSTDVGSYSSNPLGLYDMSGNVWEWCLDWNSQYPSEPVVDPIGIAIDLLHIIRGGSYRSNELSCRSAYRNVFEPDEIEEDCGFRVVQRPGGGSQSDVHTVQGRVVYNGSGLADVSVSLDGKTITTGQDGTFSFTDRYEGTYSIIFVKQGYIFNPDNLEVSVSDNDITVDDVIASMSDDSNLPTDLVFAAIPGGTFAMGDEVGDLSDICRPVHEVTVSDFEMSIHEITNAQYAEFLSELYISGDISATEYQVTAVIGDFVGQIYIDIDNVMFNNNGVFSVYEGYENLPVVSVTWYGAKAFANYYGLDLPTEAEWEYACRGGRQNLYGTSNGDLDETKAFYYEYGFSIEVGSYPANPFGLYDMSGNVWEWCHDLYEDYSSESVNNPIGALSGTDRVFRGGSFESDIEACRSASRYHVHQVSFAFYLGFRVVRRPDGLIY